jgi:beta-glucosidase
VADAVQYGADAVGEILVGKVSPSGSLPETATQTSAPAGESIMPMAYSGAEETSGKYLIYREGIYIGYSYYETRYEDVVMATGNPGDYIYGAEVVFPFGYGMGYTSFAYSGLAVSYSEETDRYQVSVTVTNTGASAGKETVQIYAQSPYTQYDVDNKVEKASVKLVGFGKTATLEPGGAETVSVEVERSTLASFDTYGTGTYILDAGDYYLTVATDSHNAVNNILAAKGYTVENTEGRMDRDGNGAMTYRIFQESFDEKTYADQVTNRLSQADPNLQEGENQQETRWLSRSDWERTYPKEKQELLTLAADQAAFDETAEIPTMGAKNGVKLQELTGIPYDDPKWEQLLDQLSYGEMVSLVGDGFGWQMPVRSIHAPGVREEDARIEKLQEMIGKESEKERLPSGKLAAAGYNTELLYRHGNAIGDCALAEETPYAQTLNADVQRVPGSDGISEDAFLTGMTSAAQVSGAKEKGVVLAVDIPDSGETAVDTWFNEQTAGEVYLRTLELCWADRATFH